MKSAVAQPLDMHRSSSWLDRALRANPQNRSAQRGLGFSLLQQGDDHRAVAAWQQVDNMGRELYHMGQQAGRFRLQQQAADEEVTDRRFEWYNLSAQVDPSLRDPWYQMGQLHEQKGEWAAAENAYRNGLQTGTHGLEIQGSDLRFWLARLIEKHHEPPDLVGALALYDQAISENAYGDPWVQAQTHYRRGEILREQGQLDEAARAYETVIVLHPKSYWALINLAQLVQQKNDIELAESYLLQAIEVNPKAHFAYRLLGQVYQAESRLAEAKEMYQQALERNEDDAVSREQLGRITVPSQ